MEGNLKRTALTHRITRGVVLSAFSIFYLLPLFWMILISFSGGINIYEIFSHGSPKHYIAIFKEGYARYLLNSAIIGSFATLLSLALGVPAAYSLAFSRFKAKEGLHFWILTSQMIPVVVFLIPYFGVYRNLRLMDTYLGMILIYTVINLGLVVWLMRGFFEEIPRDLYDAALVDGCSPIQAFSRIYLPLVIAGLGITTIICFIFCWNEFLLATMLTARRAKTLPVTIYDFMGGYQIYWGGLAAASALTVVPVVLMGIIIRKSLIRGLTFGAIKG